MTEVFGSGNDGSFDLVVVGLGPAGEKGAAQAAHFGKRVKTLRETALYLSGLRSRNLYGIE